MNTSYEVSQGRESKGMFAKDLFHGINRYLSAEPRKGFCPKSAVSCPAGVCHNRCNTMCRTFLVGATR